MDPLEREIADAVNVHPSPEFVARVRTRIATEGTSAAWRVSTPLLASVAFAATIAIVVWVVRLDHVPSETMAAGRVQVTSAPLSAQTMTREASTTSAPPVERTSGRHQQRQQSAPRVIVAANELKGLRQLSDLMRGGTVALTFDDVQSLSPQPVQEIVVTPIEIAPLTAASTWDQGDEQ